jgi:hypothetical protein
VVGGLATVAAVLIVAVGFPAPAFASDIALQFDNPNVSVTTGKGPATVNLNFGAMQDAKDVKVDVSSDKADYVDIKVDKGNCAQASGASVTCKHLRPGEAKSVPVTITPKDGTDLAEGDTVAGTITATVAGPNAGTTTTALSIVGGESGTNQITGTVLDLKKKPVKDAQVTIWDGEQKKHGPRNTDDKGKFTIEEHFAEGQGKIEVKKSGYTTYSDTVPISTGSNSPIEVPFEKKASHKDDPTTKAANSSQPNVSDPGLGATGWIIVILGTLLVIGGIVAIVMLLRRGKDDEEEEDEDLDANIAPIHRPTATQTGQLGVYDAASRRPGMDSPTMIHNGPLYDDDELARYGSNPGGPGAGPAASGFGPAYGDQRPTEMVNPHAEPVSGATQRYPAAQPEAPTSGATQMYPSAPTSGATQMYGAATPEPRSGGGYQGYQSPPSQDQYGYGSADQYREPGQEQYRGAPQDQYVAPQEPYVAPQEPYRGGAPDPYAPGAGGQDPYRGGAPDPYGGGGQDQQQYRGGQQDQYGYGPADQYRDPAPRQPGGRHYREDDDDRPHSW